MNIEESQLPLGRRVGIYTDLEDCYYDRKHESVEQILHKLKCGSNQLDDKVIYALMERLI